MIESKLLPNTATYNTVIMAQAEANNMEKASAVFSLLTSSRSKAKPNRQTYNILVRALNANAQPATSEFYLNHMKEAGMKPDVELLTATVSSYERSKEPLKALQMMESMREDGYDFYQMKLFDAAFKQGVKVINNVVGKRTISEEDFQD
jgi:pentatricopeptide repeat protein